MGRSKWVVLVFGVAVGCGDGNSASGDSAGVGGEAGSGGRGGSGSGMIGVAASGAGEAGSDVSTSGTGGTALGGRPAGEAGEAGTGEAGTGEAGTVGSGGGHGGASGEPSMSAGLGGVDEQGGAAGGESGAGGAEEPGRTSCDPDPEDTPGTGAPDPNGCTFEGDVILPGITDASGMRVSVVGFALSTQTDELGHYVIEDVPAGTHRLHFRRGDFHETIPAVSCQAGVAMVDGTLLSAAPLEVLPGSRITDGAPLNLAPETDQRVFHSTRPPADSLERPYAVDHECGPAAVLPCHYSGSPLDGNRAAVCFSENGIAVVSVPADATKSEVVFDEMTTARFFQGGRYVAYTKPGILGLFDVRTQSAREFDVSASSPFKTFSSDEKYFLFTDSEYRLRLTPTAGGDVAIVDTFTYVPGYVFSVVMEYAPDGSFVAYVPPFCEACELRLLEMDATVRPLAMVRPSNASFRVSPNSKVIVAELDTGEVVGYLTATGERVDYPGVERFSPAFIAGGAAVAFTTATGTVLYDAETGEILDDSPAGSLLATTSDGQYVFQMMADESDTSKTKLMLWDTAASTVIEIEPDLETFRNVVIAPDEQSAFFVARSGNQRMLRRLVLDAELEITTIAVAGSVATTLSFSPDGKLAFDENGYTLQLLMPGSSQPFTLTKSLGDEDVTWLAADALIIERNEPRPYEFQRGAYVLHVPREATAAN